MLGRAPRLRLGEMRGAAFEACVTEVSCIVPSSAGVGGTKASIYRGHPETKEGRGGIRPLHRQLAALSMPMITAVHHASCETTALAMNRTRARGGNAAKRMCFGNRAR